MRLFSRPPTIPADTVRELAARGMSSPEIVAHLEREHGIRCSAGSVRSILSRSGQKGAAPRPAVYAFHELFPDIRQAHRATNTYYMLTAYERIKNGDLDPSSRTGQRSLAFIGKRLRRGLVVEYNPAVGFHDERWALPWELGQVFRLPSVPDGVQPELEIAAYKGLIGPLGGVAEVGEGSDRVIVQLAPAHAISWNNWMEKNR